MQPLALSQLQMAGDPENQQDSAHTSGPPSGKQAPHGSSHQGLVDQLRWGRRGRWMGRWASLLARDPETRHACLRGCKADSRAKGGTAGPRWRATAHSGAPCKQKTLHPAVKGEILSLKFLWGRIKEQASLRAEPPFGAGRTIKTTRHYLNGL